MYVETELQQYSLYSDYDGGETYVFNFWFSTAAIKHKQLNVWVDAHFHSLSTDVVYTTSIPRTLLRWIALKSSMRFSFTLWCTRFSMVKCLLFMFILCMSWNCHLKLRNKTVAVAFLCCLSSAFICSPFLYGIEYSINRSIQSVQMIHFTFYKANLKLHIRRDSIIIMKIIWFDSIAGIFWYRITHLLDVNLFSSFRLLVCVCVCAMCVFVSHCHSFTLLNLNENEISLRWKRFT